MAATIFIEDRQKSLAMAHGTYEMNDELRDFNRSLAVTQGSEIRVQRSEDALTSSNAILLESSTSLESIIHLSENSDAVQHSTLPNQDLALPDESKIEKRFIAPKDFELLKVIGMGAFGKVLQVRNRHSAQIYAMKVISKRLIKRKGSYVENILAERNILKKIANHPFIVTMHASFQTKEKLFIIMDLCAGGELFLKLGREGIFRERTAAFYLAEITLALEHLHSINVLHRDLKPENILLSSDGHCCLTDFGLAKDFTGSGADENERARTLCGTCEYMAPEMVARKWYGKGADFWSLGCIAYEMLSGQPPFSSNKGSKELFRKIMSERVRMPDGASASACKLLKGLLNRDAGNRLGAARGNMFEVGGVGALKQQPFFSGLDWGKLELKEIAPPEEFSVDNDEDLRHFHDEFVNMALPRSVKEMSKLDFLPRHCESEHFRGFSFIGDGFPLPGRNSMELEYYWNNCDEDGQSLSECASSVFDDDCGEFPAPEPMQEKKKRPPRKKKAKQPIPIPPLETTDEGTEPIENMLTEIVIGQSVGVFDKKIISNDAQNSSTNNSHKSVITTRLDNPTPNSESKRLDGSTETCTKQNTATKTLNPNAKAWGESTQSTPASHNCSQIKLVQAKPTWASMAGSKGMATHSPMAEQPVSTAITHHAVSSAAISNPSSSRIPAKGNTSNSDWTTHVVSYTRKKASKQNHAPPPPTAGQFGQMTWPTLEDFPPPPSAKRTEPTQAKSMGVWGRPN